MNVKDNSMIDFVVVEDLSQSIIKVVGVGGGGSKLKEIIILSRNIVLEDGRLINCENLERIMLHKDMYETLLPHLPCRENLKITKIYSHHFLFFKW